MSARVDSFDLTFNGSWPAIRVMSRRVVPTGLVWIEASCFVKSYMGRAISFDITGDGSRPARRGRSGREDSSDVTCDGSLPARRILSGRLDSSDPARVVWRLSLHGMSRRVGGLYRRWWTQ